MNMTEIKTLADVEREYILSVLSDLCGNRTHAAKALAISIRTLRNKINLFRSQGHMPPALVPGNASGKDANGLKDEPNTPTAREAATIQYFKTGLNGRIIRE